MEQIEVIGTVVFAISGVFAIVERRLDWFGAAVVGVVTALGGGTLRDLALGVDPVFWVEDETYLIAAVAGALAALACAHTLGGASSQLELTVQVADAAGLALFSYVGAQATLDLGYGAFLAVSMAVLTAVGGGLIRDVLSGRTPLVLTAEIYATAALAGAAVYALSVEVTGSAAIAATLGVGTTLTLRLVSLRREWALPVAGRREKRF